MQEATGEETGAEPGRNGPGPTGLGRPAQPTPGLVRRPFLLRCLSIYCLYLRRLLHPSIYQRVVETKEKHQEEADGRRKSSSCLGDGLGHAIAAMVGLAW
jgi:hypothetical protein